MKPADPPCEHRSAKIDANENTADAIRCELDLRNPARRREDPAAELDI